MTIHNKRHKKKWYLPSSASRRTEKSSSSVHDVLETTSPGRSSRSRTSPPANRSVSSVSSGLEEENSVCSLASLRKSSCFSNRVIGLKVSAGLSYNVVALKNKNCNTGLEIRSKDETFPCSLHNFPVILEV